jgi:hypothetical protein
MRLILLLSLSIFLFADEVISFKDNDPMNITNISELKKLDKLAYELVEDTHTNTIDTSKVFRFILQHKSHILGYSFLKVNARGKIGTRTRRASLEGSDEDITNINSAGFPDDYNYYDVGVAVTYPLYDEKTAKSINNETVLYKAKLLDIIKNYQESLAENTNLVDRREYYRLLQLRAKARQKTGQIYLDERLEIMEKILELNERLRTNKITLDGMKLILLNYVQDPYQNELEKML